MKEKVPKKITESFRLLTGKGIRPSVQRLAVMDYLLTHRTHPTVEEIYSGLSSVLPTLSKTTVYNTLRILSEHGAVLHLDIDPKNSRYDGFTTPHGHIMCTRCGMIRDFPLEETAVYHEKHFSRMRITEVAVHLKGVCEHCMENDNTTQYH